MSQKCSTDEDKRKVAIDATLAWLAEWAPEAAAWVAALAAAWAAAEAAAWAAALAAAWAAK